MMWFLAVANGAVSSLNIALYAAGGDPVSLALGCFGALLCLVFALAAARP